MQCAKVWRNRSTVWRWRSSRRALNGLLKLNQTEQTKAAQVEFKRACQPNWSHTSSTDTLQGLDQKFIKRFGIQSEKIKVVWADHLVHCEDISAQPYSWDTTNINYVISVIALSNHNDLPALGSDFITQEPLESGWVFYWDESTKVRYSDSGKSFTLPLSFKKWCSAASALKTGMIFEIVLQYVLRHFQQLGSLVACKGRELSIHWGLKSAKIRQIMKKCHFIQRHLFLVVYAYFHCWWWWLNPLHSVVKRLQCHQII